MAIKSSGALYLYNDIGRYFGVSRSNVSLRNLSSRAGKGTPDAMSEFYGYGGGPTPPPPVVAPPPPVATPPPPVATPPPVTVAPPPPVTPPPTTPPPPTVVPTPPPTTPPPPPPTTPPPTTPPPTTPPPVTPPPVTPPPTAPPPVATPRPPAITCAPLPEVGFSSFSPASACEAFPTSIFSNVGEICDNSGQGRIYSNSRCTSFANSGYYSQFNNQYRYWSGSQYTSICAFCTF